MLDEKIGVENRRDIPFIPQTVKECKSGAPSGYISAIKDEHGSGKAMRESERKREGEKERAVRGYP